MNFELDQVELAVIETAEQVAREVIQPRAQHYDETETFCADSLQGPGRTRLHGDQPPGAVRWTGDWQPGNESGGRSGRWRMCLDRFCIDRTLSGD